MDERCSNLSRRETSWLNRAVRLAQGSQQRHKHACIIVRGGSVQGYGVNVGRNTPGIIDNIDALAVHAEIRALRICSRTDGAVAYIARVNNNDEKRQSRPCPNCINALVLAGVKRVIYTINGSMYL